MTSSPRLHWHIGVLLLACCLMIAYPNRGISAIEPPKQTLGAIVWVDWSPDGEKFVLESLDNLGSSSIWVVNTDGSNPSRLTDEEENANVPKWSPDGKWIAYLHDYHDIAILAPDGSKNTIITTDVYFDDSIYVDPFFEWSPDSQRIVISAGWAPTEELPLLGSIWVVNTDGSAPIQIVEEQPIYDLYIPNWSADSQKVLFTTVQPKGRPAAISVVDIETLSQTTITSGPYSAAYFSPNASSIAAFSVAECDQGFDIVLIEIETLEATNPTHSTCSVLPAPLQWSPDSQHIAFQTSLDIWAVLNLSSLETKSFTGSRPTWSSDGQRIAYLSSEVGGPSIWILSMDDFSTVRVTIEGE